ncbi:hypothetical protein KAR91_85280 [Candidatus Pacearchaeota archaeon]|nr:hypothetical protein [Candidatus Pacearchaeota archaeon]
MIKRIYHPYWRWEECKYNMWGKVKGKKDWLQRAIEFTGDHLLYGQWMIKVVNDWKYSCEHNLSDRSQNRQAWIGHAAVAYAIQCPEDIVRQAWGFLTEEQQRLANDQADSAILLWEKNNA